jgi:uncharacterized protein
MRVLKFRAALAAIALVSAASPSQAAEPLTWRGWGADLFQQKPDDQRLVILDLEAVWCHWCHVMEQTTYQDAKVTSLLKSNFITVRVDQDANPDLSNRYGDWGWPATIIFGPKGEELIKRRGYLDPQEMAVLLEAVIKDPTPGPSVSEEAAAVPSDSPALTKDQRTELTRLSNEAFDKKFGGWGDGQKFIDVDAMDYLLARASKGDAAASDSARKTFDAALHIIDREWGGIYQYSDQPDWLSPHYEKIMWYQANGLRQFSAAFTLWKDAKYRAAADNIYRYLTTKLANADGGFYTSQDADVNAKLPGKTFYAMTSADRDKLGRAPRIDTHIYARENGWAISGIVAYANATGNAAPLAVAEKAAQFTTASRKRSLGGFSHGDSDRGGPYLGDTLAMGQAMLDLYAATGNRTWLDEAEAAGDFIAKNFIDSKGGFLTTATPEGSVGAFLNPAKAIDEQSAATRFANALHRYLGAAAYRTLAEHGMRYLASKDLLDRSGMLPGVLLADADISTVPTHITIVGPIAEAKTQSLQTAARAVPIFYKRVDLWDRSKGPLKNPDVTYPELDEPAAFLCTNRICSLPAFTIDDLNAALQRALKTSAK